MYLSHCCWILKKSLSLLLDFEEVAFSVAWFCATRRRRISTPEEGGVTAKQCLKEEEKEDKDREEEGDGREVRMHHRARKERNQEKEEMGVGKA